MRSRVCRSPTPSARPEIQRNGQLLRWCRALIAEPSSVAVRVSPLGEGAVGVAPDRVAPAVTLAGPFAYVLLVHLDAEARTPRDGHHALVVGEDGWVGQVVQGVVAGVVVDAQALLLD